jgi:hypothetical protein
VNQRSVKTTIEVDKLKDDYDDDDDDDEMFQLQSASK